MTGRGDVLALVADLGAVRRLGPAVWSATCPSCRRGHALRVRRSVGGELATCPSCGVLDVRAALDRLTTETTTPR